MDDKKEILLALSGSIEVMGQEYTPAAMALMVEDLAQYPAKDVLTALARVRRECNKITLAAIIDRIPGGWPGSDEAWATFPKDESETGVVTGEAMRAWGAAISLWEDGDKIGARMAFKSAYDREVSQATTAKPVWTVTIGYDLAGREAVIRRAIDLGQLERDKVTHLIPAPKIDDHGHIVGLITGKVSSLPVDGEQRARLGELKAMMERTAALRRDKEERARLEAVARRKKERARQLAAAKQFEREHISEEGEKKARAKMPKPTGTGDE